MRTDTTLQGSLVVPGRAEHLRAVRRFVAGWVADGSYAFVDTAVLLTSELVSNSMQHSDSGSPGGTVTVTVTEIPGGIRAEIADRGGVTIPAVRQEAALSQLAEGGRGLQLVDRMADRWGYCRDEAGGVTWFELTGPRS